MDAIELNWYIEVMLAHLEGREPNFVDVIARSRGWLPLVEGEQMWIHYGNKYYRIERLEDHD